jgi:xylan 1,4-beta-xylosidase
METDGKVNFKIDAGSAEGELNHVWRYIGYDECNYTSVPEGRELLAKFGSLGDAPYYVRVHHLLCTGNCHGTYKWGSTNVYSEDGHGNPVYYWQIIDNILDILLENNCKPFLELGFMPMDLLDGAFFEGVNEWEAFGKYKSIGWSMPPKDYGKWHELIRNLVRHCVRRYGQEEVLTWYWELWNEPDIFYWRGTPEEFCKLYDYTEAAIHAALPGARLGGPATTGPVEGPGGSLEFLEKFLDHCRNGINEATGQKGTRLDYVTFHTKGGGFPFKVNAPKATPSVKSMVRQVRLGLEAVRKYGYGDLEVVLSEADPDGWAAGGRFDNRNMNFRNTEYYASFVASSYNHIGRLAAEMGMDVRPLAWAFLFVGERCFEGTRTFSTQGIDKPVFNLFKMYSRMGPYRLNLHCSQKYHFLQEESCPEAQAEGEAASEAMPEVSGMASGSDDGNVRIMVYSHHDDWDIAAENRVSIELSGLKSGDSYNVKHYRIDKNYSNAYAEWVSRGSPDYPTKQTYDAIKRKDELELLEPGRSVSISGDRLELDFSLPAHAVSLIELIKE